jgi:hypothetical protein
MWVRMPAAQFFRSRSLPTSAPRTAASDNRSNIWLQEIIFYVLSIANQNES